MEPQAASDVDHYDTYAKHSAITGLRTTTTFGQPSWDTVFESICNLHASPEKVGVFFSGPSVIGRQISVSSQTYSRDGFAFVWSKGKF